MFLEVMNSIPSCLLIAPPYQRPRKVQDLGKIFGLNKHLFNNCGKDIIRIIVNHTAYENVARRLQDTLKRKELKITKAARKRNRTSST
mmetsp:Transcript_28668/g.92195  ORF Transcript_28668/g.92195 Transcript_28668/m.92195 type:complete len:88 (-) Transcript_28668:454-717(-)